MVWGVSFTGLGFAEARRDPASVQSVPLKVRAGHEMAFACMELLSTSTGCLASELLSDGTARALSPADEGPSSSSSGDSGWAASTSTRRKGGHRGPSGV